MTATIAERVAAGAALLDEREPGWWQRINLARLDLEAPCRCILGQLDDDLGEGRWRDLLARFGVAACDDAYYGFNAEEGRQEPGQYASLTAAWRELIGARREAEGWERLASAAELHLHGIRSDLDAALAAGLVGSAS